MAIADPTDDADELGVSVPGKFLKLMNDSERSSRVRLLRRNTSPMRSRSSALPPTKHLERCRRSRILADLLL